MSSRRGMHLEKVVLLGRTLDEYRGYFLLDPGNLEGKQVLDVAGGVSSFCAEAHALGIRVTSVDPIYRLSADEIEQRSGPDLQNVIAQVRDLPTYRWRSYRDPEHVRELRQKALTAFLKDYRMNRGRYLEGALPSPPFADRTFDLSLVSYFLFVYQDHFDYEFHRASLVELMRVTKGEVRIYPTVTFEAEPSIYLERLLGDPVCRDLQFEEVKTDFEFLANSNRFLRVTHRSSQAAR